MNFNFSPTAALLFGVVALASVTAHADTLAGVKKKGELACGVLSTAKPFGFVDTTQSRDVVGYDVDICHALAKSLGVKSVVRQVANDARIPELVQGRVDVLTAALSWTPERAQQVDFTNQYFVARLVVAAQKDAGVSNIAGLKGKRVSVVKGSTSEIALRNNHPDVPVVSFPDPPSAFLAFQQGKTEAFSISELLMRRFLNEAGPAGAKMTLLSDTLQVDPWGVGVKKGEKGLLDALNDALVKMEASGESKAIFDRWFNEKTGFAIPRSFKFEPIKAK